MALHRERIISRRAGNAIKNAAVSKISEAVNKTPFVNRFDYVRSGLSHRMAREEHFKLKDVRENFNGVMKILNLDGLMMRDREKLRPELKEMHDIRNLALEAIEHAMKTGEIKKINNLEDFRKYFQNYLREWLVRTHQNPGAASYAPKAATKFITFLTFRNIEKKFDVGFGKLVRAAKGESAD